MAEDIGSLLEQMLTEDGRAQAVLSLLKRQVDADVPERFITPAIAYFEKSGQLFEAAQIADIAGQTQRAITLFLDAKRPMSAASAAVDAGLFDKAIKLYVELERFELAGRAAQKAGYRVDAERYFDIAIRRYEQEGRYGYGLNKAAKVAEEAGWHDRAKQLYLKIIEVIEMELKRESPGGLYGSVPVNELILAAQIAEKVGLPEQEERFYRLAISRKELSGDLDEAARIASQEGFADKAAELYSRIGLRHEQNGDIFRAAEAYANGGLTEKALILFEKEGTFQTAARVAQEAGLHDKAQAYWGLYQMITKEK